MRLHLQAFRRPSGAVGDDGNDWESLIRFTRKDLTAPYRNLIGGFQLLDTYDKEVISSRWKHLQYRIGQEAMVRQNLQNFKKIKL